MDNRRLAQANIGYSVQVERPLVPPLRLLGALFHT
jgi:hypothetical protein